MWSPRDTAGTLGLRHLTPSDDEASVEIPSATAMDCCLLTIVFGGVEGREGGGLLMGGSLGELTGNEWKEI